MPKYHPDLITYTAFKTLKGIDTDDDQARIETFIHGVSSWMQERTQRTFVPYEDTRTFDARGSHLTSRRLRVDDDLLAVGTLTNGNAEVIAASARRLLPSNVYPKYEVELLPSANKAWAYADDWQDALTVAGIWGFHENYPKAWKSHAPLTAALSSATGTLVALANGTLGLEVLGYALCEGEQMQIRAVASGTLTVDRGVNGTTATTHNAGAEVKVYQQTPAIALLAHRATLFFYEHRDTIGTRIEVAGNATLVEGLIPDDLKQAVLDYRRDDLLIASD